jgi:large subunit ribosomal protein L22
MTGPKLNEGALLIPEGQPTTKATAKYLRGSASKAREVLDLIRGLDVRRADEVLQFTTRDVAQDIRKVLASAVANAMHNDAQDAEELFVLAAFADEGPTLRRFRPRARGRATRIRKRTCHITIVVTRLSDERLEILQARQQASSPAGRRRAGTTVQSRRDRVERSRTRAQGLRAGATETPEASAEELPEETPAADAEVVDATEVIADEVEGADDTADDTAMAETPETAASAKLQAFADAVAPADDEAPEAETEAPAAEIELPEGAVAAPEDGSIPAGYEIKGNQNSMKYHVPGGRYYDITIAELFFDTPEHAEAAGYEPPAADTEGDS